MLEFVEGDFFSYNADIRVNTVNCVGVMGAGAALAFKRKYPNMYRDYVRACKSGDVRPGKPHVWEEGDIFTSIVTIVNFPTKDDWRNPSEYEYVKVGLRWLRKFLETKNDVVVTLPALGCGHGGLDWDEVKLLIQQYLADVPAKILVFPPSSSKKIPRSYMTPSVESQSALSARGIKVVNATDPSYPTNFLKWTEKQLYVKGTLYPDESFDVALISSTQPEEKEKLVVSQFMEYTAQNSLSLIIGSTAYEKKLVATYGENLSNTAIMVPSGILENDAVELSSDLDNVTILSLGDPMTKFNRADYMPSVLARAYLSKSVLFTTPKLAWLDKYKKHFKRPELKLYFIRYSDMDDLSLSALVDLNAIPIGRNKETLQPNFLISASAGNKHKVLR